MRKTLLLALLTAPEGAAQLGAPMDRASAEALLAAHMIIFWFSQDSNVTPPVCLAAFAAAALGLYALVAALLWPVPILVDLIGGAAVIAITVWTARRGSAYSPS